MSATGLDVFDRTPQTTNAWLGQITKTLRPDRQIAWRPLRDFDIKVNGFVFWPVMFGLFAILLPLAMRVFG